MDSVIPSAAKISSCACLLRSGSTEKDPLQLTGVWVCSAPCGVAPVVGGVDPARRGVTSQGR